MWTLIRLLLEEQSDLGSHCLKKSQVDDKADDNCCDWQFKGCNVERDVKHQTIIHITCLIYPFPSLSTQSCCWTLTCF